MQKSNKERLYEIIRSPMVTEKTTALSSNNQVVFEVVIDANKKEIKDSVKFLFNVDTIKIATIITSGKKKIFKGRVGKRKDIKKAIVTLKEGQNIDLSSGV